MGLITELEFKEIKDRAQESLRIHWEKVMKEHLETNSNDETKLKDYECCYQYHLIQEALKEGVKRGTYTLP